MHGVPHRGARRPIVRVCAPAAAGAAPPIRAPPRDLLADAAKPEI